MADWRNPANNLHLRKQVLENVNADGTPIYHSLVDTHFERMLNHGRAPRSKYRRRNHEKKSVIHWGQRKLLISEIEFINIYIKQAKIVLYAGAAPGTHIDYLSALFPDLLFICIDPAPFTLRERPGHIEIRQTLFTDQTAKEFANTKGLLFISDIRSADWQILKEGEVEDQIKSDMEAQKRWHLLMNPIASQLKFRLPWGSGKTEYLKGMIHFPVWGPITTTEARLICSGNDTTKYDNTRYEEEMFHFNTHQRIAMYDHECGSDRWKNSQYDHCYDCKAEIEILRRHLERNHHGQLSAKQQCEMIIQMSFDMNRIASNRTLKDPNPDPGQRHKKIVKRQFIQGKPAYYRRPPWRKKN